MMPFILTALGFFVVIIIIGFIDLKMKEANEEKLEKERKQKELETMYEHFHRDEDAQYKQDQKMNDYK